MKLRASRPPSSCCAEVWEVPHAGEKPTPASEQSHDEYVFQKLSGKMQQRVGAMHEAPRDKSPWRDREGALPPVDEDVESGEKEDDLEKFATGQSKSSGGSKKSEGPRWIGDNILKMSPGRSPGTFNSNSSSSDGSKSGDLKAVMGNPTEPVFGGSEGSQQTANSCETGNSKNNDQRPRSGCPAWVTDAIRGKVRAKPLSKHQRWFVNVTFSIFRTLSMVLPLVVFAILMAGPEYRAVARRVAGLSALVAICHGLLARSPLHVPQGQRPRKSEDLAVELFEFTDMACTYSFRDCLRLVEQASTEEVMALSLLIKLTRTEKKKSGVEPALRRKEFFKGDGSKSTLSGFGTNPGSNSGSNSGSLGDTRGGTPARGPKLSLDRSRSNISTPSAASSFRPVGTGDSLGARQVNSRYKPMGRQSSGVSGGLGRSRSNLSSSHSTFSQDTQRSNYLRSRSNLSSSEDKERKPLLQRDLTKSLNRSASHLSAASRPGFKKSLTSNSEISISSFTDFNKRNSHFRIGNGAAATVGASPLVLPQSPFDKPTRNESNMAVANEKLEFLGLGHSSGPMQTVTEEDSEGTKSSSKVEIPAATSAEAGAGRDFHPESVKTLFMELDFPSSLSSGSSGGGSRAGGSLTNRGGPQGEFKISLPNSGEMQTAVDCVSDAGMTYVSSCDAVLGAGNNAGEIVSAEVVNLGKNVGGTNRIRIEFKSKCLRTQNEWQRRLINQQEALMEAMSTELEMTRSRLVSSDQLKTDQKELLRSFRKIVTREVATQAPHNQGLPQFGVRVFIVEEDPEVRAELEELCKMCDYPCEAFAGFFSAMPAIKQWKDKNSSVNSSPKSANSPQVSRRPSKAVSEKLAPLVLLGSSMLQQTSPGSGWKDKDEDLFVALTSQVEDFEEVGRQLLASAESEVRELLRERGISEYLMHPVSMSCLRGVASEVLKKHFGEEYLLVDTIGRGASGVVYRAKRLRDGDVFALKEISIRRLNARARQEVMTETALLVELSWPTLVYLVDAFVSSNEQLQYLMMPILEGGNLGQLAAAAEAEDCKISAEHAMEWYAQTVHGVSYLHWCGVLHRDLKPANLLLDADERVLQIGDLGSAARLPGPGPHPNCRSCVHKDITTIAYSSPETIAERVHYPGSDLWAVGVSFYQVFTLSLPHEPGELNLGGLFSAPHEDGAHALNARRLSSEGRDVVGPVRAALRDSDLSDEGVIEEIANELEELMRADPFSRPTAVSLITRPGTERRLWNVLRGTGAFPDSQTEADHLLDLADLKRDAEAAVLGVTKNDAAPGLLDTPGNGQEVNGDSKPKALPASVTVMPQLSPHDRFGLSGLASI